MQVNHQPRDRSESDQRRYDELCKRLGEVAGRTTSHIPEMDVAGAFIGTGINVLVNVLGRDGALSYLRDLSDAITNDVSHSHEMN